MAMENVGLSFTPSRAPFMRSTDRGYLSSLSPPTIIHKSLGESWGLDALGNWSGFQEDSDGNNTLDLNQTRVSNAANEIDVDADHANAAGASITASTGTNWYDPTYDAAGNMTSVPKASDLTNGEALKYDAWNRMVVVANGSATSPTRQ